MSFRDNQDLRVRGNGGWAYAEHELWSVFAPIIGPSGCFVYMALCRLVPLAGINSDRPVTVRRVSEYACVGRSKCAELMQQIFKLGMVIETKYLDGRAPSYKLASLQDLAKVGQAELLQRIGVRNTDTAPFDQTVKLHKERRDRKLKNRTERGEEQLAKPMPLLDDVDDDDTDGVRHADTTPGEPNDAAGVRNTDTVSTKTAFVSANSELVSTKTGFVSAPADTLKEERSEEKNTNPLPPAEQGEVGDPPDGLGSPNLPFPNATVADPNFGRSLPHAARWVMAELGITKQRFEPMITAQLTMRCRTHRSETLDEAAMLMARQGKKLHADAHLLRHRPWGWNRFISEGHWQRPLPYASPSSESSVGVLKASAAGSEPAEQPRSHLLGLAGKLRKHAPLLDIAAELASLADQAGALSQTEIEDALTALQERTVNAMLDSYGERQRESIAKLAETELQSALRRYPGMPVQDQEVARARWRQRILFNIAELPDLALPLGFVHRPANT